MLKYYNYDIVFQEVPDEVSLALNLTDCPNHCRDCHSPHLWEDVGIELTDKEMYRLLDIYQDSITCVCLMGGDAHRNEVEKMAETIHKMSDLKVAWYSGKYEFPKNIRYFQYVKLGPYIPEKGNLKSKTTNQRFYKNCEDGLKDFTCLFNGKER